MFVSKDSASKQTKLVKSPQRPSGELSNSRSRNKDRKDKRRSRSKQGKHLQKHYTQPIPDEQDIFGLNILKHRLLNKKKKPHERFSMPTTTVDQDIIEQQELTIKSLTKQLEKQRQKGKQLLKALHSVNTEIQKEKQIHKFDSRVK